MPHSPAHEQWHGIATHRELGMARLKVEMKENYNEHTKNLMPIQIGDIVTVQNMEGPKPNRWDKTARIVECMGNRQYSLVMDGSRRLVFRNRKFLRKIHPATADLQQPEPMDYAQQQRDDQQQQHDARQEVCDGRNNVPTADKERVRLDHVDRH